MEFEIKVKGDLYEDRHEMLIIAHANDLWSLVNKVKDKIRTRHKYCEDVTDKEYDFLEELQEILYMEWME